MSPARRERVRGVGRFRNDVARRRYMTAYDSALATWPTRPQQLDVETRYGATHVLATAPTTSGPKSAAPIVLIHAVAVASPSWSANIAALAEYRPVYAIDTIGDVGRSTQTAPVRTAVAMASWLDDVLAALDLHGVHLVGLSYGGWVALNQAVRAPDRLSSVTAVDPVGAIGRGKTTFLLRIAPDAALASIAKSDAALRRLLRLLNNGALPDEPLLELSIAGLRTFRAKQPFPRRMSDDDLRAIHTPALLLFCGSSPVNHAVQAAQRSRSGIAAATSEVIPGAGHMLPIESPELFDVRLLDFIDEIDSRGGTA
jgi:pimeloyl-ACP methyl ester carboxylesterase